MMDIEAIWANQKEDELKEAATCKESLQVQTEGKRKIKRKLKEYNLEVLIAIR